jgi:hypothetical protein
MPMFIMDLRWTPIGLANVASGAFKTIRDEAKDFVASVNPTNPLTIISIIDRIIPTPVGPIWIVEGQESDVVTVVARFNGFGNVTAQYHRYIDDAAQLDAIISPLFKVRTKPQPL